MDVIGATGPVGRELSARDRRAPSFTQDLVQVSEGDDGVPLPRNPNVVEAVAPNEPLNEALATDTAEPLVVSVPFHSWVMVCPLASVQRTVQPMIDALPAVTVTSPWNPPCHALMVR